MYLSLVCSGCGRFSEPLAGCFIGGEVGFDTQLLRGDVEWGAKRGEGRKQIEPRSILFEIHGDTDARRLGTFCATIGSNGGSMKNAKRRVKALFMLAMSQARVSTIAGYGSWCERIVSKA